MLVDAHCHIHEQDYPLDAETVYRDAIAAGVNRMVCVGTDEMSSQQAVAFAAKHTGAWASIGIHPHDAKRGAEAMQALKTLAKAERVVAVGECGLDYFYDNSPKKEQIAMLHAQLELAVEHDLPVIFHVRAAFEDFWPVFDEYKNIRGVLHSFTDSKENLDKALARRLYIGVNGISTFTKDEAQKQMYRAVPLQRLLLETDAPFLTPTPKRGSVNVPAYVTYVADYLASMHAISPEEIAEATSHGATDLFSFN